MKRVVIVGGGVVGLSLAWEFQHRGYEVVLVDERTTVGGASAINAGWLVPAMSAPVPAPGVMAQSVRWLLRPDAPLSLALRPDLAFLRWAVGFMRACSPDQFARGSAIMSRLSADALASFDRMEARGIAMERHDDGVLYAFGSEAALAHDLAFFEAHHPAGYRSVTPLRGDDLRTLEPSLTGRTVAGFLLANERSVRPESFVQALTQSLEAGGTRIEAGRRATLLDGDGSSVSAVHLDDGRRLPVDTVVVAAGVGMHSLLRTVGVRVPIEAGKGYSITWATHGAPVVQRPIYLHDDRVAVTPFDGAVRAAGMMHVGQTSEAVSARKVRAIAESVRASFAGWPEDDPAPLVGAGLRPLSPDGLPVIGRAGGFRNLFLAGGHGMLGVTLAPITAFEVAELVESGVVGERIAPLSPGRFT